MPVTAQAERSVLQRFTSRPFLLAIVGAAGAWLGHKYNIPNETIALYTAPLISFILGESYKDGQAAQGAIAVLDASGSGGPGPTAG